MISLLFLLKVWIIVALVSYVVIMFTKSMWLWYSYGGSQEYYETSKSAIKSISQYLLKNKLDRGIFYDFGSSQWRVIFMLLKTCKNLKTVGIERDIFKNFWSHMVSKFHSYKHTPVFLSEDFMEHDISKADIIFIYVPRILLPDLRKKIQKEWKNDARIILYRISFDDWNPQEEILTDGVAGISENKIFIYRVHRDF